MNWVKTLVEVKETNFVDWQTENKDGSRLEIVEFICMCDDGLRVESSNNETFAFEIDKEKAIHLAHQILTAFNCV